MIRPTGPGPFAQVIALQRPVIEILPIAAGHNGPCAGPLCRSPIRRGEFIQRVDGKWMHSECVPHDAIEDWPERREAA